MITNAILEKIKNSTFLITGGAGFIGSNLTKKLLELNAKKIIVLDDLSTGFEKNISSFKMNDNFEFIQDSITNLEQLKNYFKHVDIVFQMAALGSVPRSIDNPTATNEVNITGFMNVLIAAKENNVKKIVYSSSSSVYGDNDTIPKIESKTGNPLSPYAVTKKTNELYAEAFSKVYNMNIIGLRYFNVFGPQQNIKGAYAAVIPIFISNLLNNQPCQINGDGLISRDFTHVNNVVYANILAAFTSLSNKHDVFNIAMGNQLSLNNLYNNIEQEIKSGLKPIYKAKRIGDINNSKADISKAENALNYIPITNSKLGLTETIKWYKQSSNKI